MAPMDHGRDRHGRPARGGGSHRNTALSPRIGAFLDFIAPRLTL